MSEEQKNRIVASIVRQIYFVRMLQIEVEYTMKFPVASGIKQTLLRIKNACTNGTEQLKGYHPEFRHNLEASEEKIRDISNIVEMLALADEETVSKVEATIRANFTVNYNPEENNPT